MRVSLVRVSSGYTLSLLLYQHIIRCAFFGAENEELNMLPV